MPLSAENQRKPHQFSVTDRLPHIEVWGNEQPVELRQLDIQVKVTGLFAETTQTMQFFNPGRRILEGNLLFPLPDDAVVCGYGLDVNGILVDGVIVPKKQARQILETEERKGADPGLLEQVQGNIYQTRIYPIPADGSRTVKVFYTSKLSVAEHQASYHLPLPQVTTLREVSLRIEVRQSPNKPVITGGQGNMSMTGWRQAWLAEATLQPQLITEDLHIQLPDLPNTLHMVETTPAGETFFCISQSQPNMHDQPDWRPKRVAIAWDASGSRTDVTRDLELLQALFAGWRNCTVDIVVFRNRLDDQLRTFPVQDGASPELISYLQSLSYDGATDLSLLDFSRIPADGGEAWLFFTDGLDTFDKQLPALGTIPVIPVVNSVRRNGPLLQYLAQQSGGRVIDLSALAIKDACRQVSALHQIPRLLSAAGCENVYLQAGAKRLLISGRLREPNGKIMVLMPTGEVTEFTCHTESATAGTLLAREWAGRRIQELGVVGRELEAETMALCRQFGVVSSGTSLLVLESLDQYLEYDIEPPESLPELRKAFTKNQGIRKAKEKKEKADQVEHVVKLWQQRVKWWNRDFHADYGASRKRREIDPHDEGRDIFLMRRSQPSSQVNENVLFSAHSETLCESFPATISPSLGGDEWLSDAPSPPERTRSRSAQASITVQAWDPAVPYLQVLKDTDADNLYTAYLRQRQAYCQSPSFFLDCGDYFLSARQIEIGVRVLSNLLEFGFEGVDLLRIYAWRLQQAGRLDEAVRILEYVQKKRDDEPQSHRDLALALAERWEQKGHAIDALRAMGLLYLVVEHEWDRFPEIELIALMELNRLIHRAEAENIPIPERIDERLRTLLDLDLRISMCWDADNTDVDLHVFEPDGSRAYYAHNQTDQGGLVSRDFTRGYGPEEYVLKKALPGKYTIKAHYFGSRQQTLLSLCTVKVDVFTNYGRADEARQTLTLRLDAAGGDFVVGEVMIDGEKKQKKSEINDPQIEDFRKITLGMEMNQVVSLVGTPRQVIQHGDDGVLSLEYRLREGGLMQMNMKYVVVSVCQVVDGATVVLT